MKTSEKDRHHTNCNLPAVPDRKVNDNIDPNRLSLVRYNEKKWVNNTTIHYYFLENRSEWRGSDIQKQAVRDAFTTWKDLGIGLEFKEVSEASEAEVRIGFQPGSSWSYVGRDCIDLVPNPNQRTMNFGWDLTTPYGRDTALHEIGHALGFPHEHQNPNAGIIWDENAVYTHFNGSPNFWDRQTTYYNIIRKISPAEVEGSKWDQNSVMHYQFDAGLILHPSEFKTEPLIPDGGISEIDKDEVQKFYPDNSGEQIPELEPFLSKLIDIQPSEQLDFVIKPKRTRQFTIQTFGPVDTVMVLFKEEGDEPQYVDGDDDSGFDYNSQIKTRLHKNHTYFLRIRLYYSSDSGNGAVMLW